MRDGIYGILMFLAIGIAIVLTSLFGLQMTSYFAPKYEQVRHDVFKNSQSYNDGIIRNIRQYQVLWNTATEEQKHAIRAAIMSELNGGHEDMLPSDLRSFVAKTRDTR